MRENKKNGVKKLLESLICGALALILALILIPQGDTNTLHKDTTETNSAKSSEAQTEASALNANAVPVQAKHTGPLEDIIITVDAGHGGYDCGAVGRKTKVLEKDLNLIVANLLGNMLRDAGATVIMTRDGDYALYPEGTAFGQLKKADMASRAEIIDSNYTQILISVHMNEDRSSKSAGPQVFYQTDNVEGRELAGYLQETLNEQLNPEKKRSVNHGDYFILRHGPPSVLVECGFLSNAAEEALLQETAYQKRVALGICQGILNYCKEHKLVPSGPETPS